MESKEQISSLEEESLKRKERLKALKERATVGGNKSDNTAKKSIELPKLVHVTFF